jgi:hypothetical protein
VPVAVRADRQLQPAALAEATVEKALEERAETIRDVLEVELAGGFHPEEPAVAGGGAKG